MPSATSNRISEKKAVPGRFLLWFLCGILWGCVLTFLGGVLYLRHNLIVEIPLEGSFGGVASAVEPAARAEGWSVSTDSCSMPRVVEGQPLNLFRLCRREYAYSLLADENDRKIACMLPCAVALYRKPDGVVWLARVNMPLVSMLLGGEAPNIFREKIVPEQARILNALRLAE